MSSQQLTGDDTALLDREVQQVRPPPMYHVILLNDDYTTMEFVILVLEQVFHMDEEKALRIMLQVHQEGRAVCGTYTRDIAACKVEHVVNLARAQQHPLACVMEKAP